MKGKYYIFLILAGIILSACSNKTPDTSELKSFANDLYDDILPVYCSGANGMEYAFERYASKELKQVLDDADKVSMESEFPILGWDCDPWIFAQDFIQPKATVIKAEAKSATQGFADVQISDGNNAQNDRIIRLLLVKEDGSWKVSDFIVPESADNAQTFSEVLQSEMEAARK